ncbi:FecR family protein [Chitinophaga vietnamensis]|uniref:FecR family protein n=1 Tax=Chitinophaga vietnamensis TaxID=2593957 RepID=UPI001177A0EC|nr:FecR domain-containing protein [Chitinophaga vietnamensis]
MAARNYHLYNASELALDEDFQEWVLHPEAHHVFWENWLRQYPEKESTVQEARRLVASIRFRDYQLPPEEKEQLWEAIRDGHESVAARPSQHGHWRQWWKYAAAVIIGAAISAGWWYTHPAQEPALFSTHTSLGETRTWMLPDSSEVTLNADSRLLYTDGKTREVWLDGEAFFHVKHKSSQQKFIVHTFDHLSVEVLGTQFNVNSRGKDIKVVLQQGSIRLHIEATAGKKEAELSLVPGEMVCYNKQDGDYTKSSVDAIRYTSWHTGKLIMEDFTLADAAGFMQQVFGKKFIVQDSALLRYKVSGSMPIIYNADTMMAQLGKVFPIHYRQQQDDIWIQRK